MASSTGDDPAPPYSADEPTGRPDKLSLDNIEEDPATTDPSTPTRQRVHPDDCKGTLVRTKAASDAKVTPEHIAYLEKAGLGNVDTRREHYAKMYQDCAMGSIRADINSDPDLAMMGDDMWRNICRYETSCAADPTYKVRVALQSLEDTADGKGAKAVADDRATFNRRRNVIWDKLVAEVKIGPEAAERMCLLIKARHSVGIQVGQLKLDKASDKLQAVVLFTRSRGEQEACNKVEIKDDVKLSVYQKSANYRSAHPDLAAPWAAALVGISELKPGANNPMHEFLGDDGYVINPAFVEVVTSVHLLYRSALSLAEQASDWVNELQINKCIVKKKYHGMMIAIAMSDVGVFPTRSMMARRDTVEKAHFALLSFSNNTAISNAFDKAATDGVPPRLRAQVKRMAQADAFDTTPRREQS